jgi:hypothetical protein
MLWKQLNPGYRRLLRSGQRGEAVVVSVKADRGGGSNVGPGIYGWNVTIRVKFPDGGTADFDRYVEASGVSSKLMAFGINPGTVLPIRFDPAKPSRVEIDTDALRSDQDRQSTYAQSVDDERVRQAMGTLPPLGSDPPDPK